MSDVDKSRPAVFLDRDGVLIKDVHLLVQPSQVQLIDGADWAVKALKQNGYLVIVVSNQTVVGRGLATEHDVIVVQEWIQHLLIGAGSEPIDAFRFCPHHPNATIPQYRLSCACRKPRPGLLLQAAIEHSIDLARSYMVGDRITDIIAGKRAGCITVLVESGQQLAPPIESEDPIDLYCHPDFVCADLRHAAQLILEKGL